MHRMSTGAIIVFAVFVALSILAKQLFFDFTGLTGILVAAASGGLGGLLGATIGIILFPKKDKEHD